MDELPLYREPWEGNEVCERDVDGQRWLVIGDHSMFPVSQIAVIERYWTRPMEVDACTVTLLHGQGFVVRTDQLPDNLQIRALSSSNSSV